MVSGFVASVDCSADTAVAAGADLTVTDLYWTDMFGWTGSTGFSTTAGQPYTVHATIENSGAGDSGAFSTDLYIDGIFTGTLFSSEGLAAMKTMTVSWEGVYTSDPGDHEASVVADSENSVAELNDDGTAESNNLLEEGFSVVRAEWTVAIYLDADNNLEYYALFDFLEMASVGTSSAVNVVVQLDRAGGYTTDYGDWTDAKRFLVTEGMEPWAESAYEDLDEVDMGDGATLSDFASDTFERFRAAKTCLILWDHGGNWYKGCCRDETSSNDSLKTGEMRSALTEVTDRTGSKVDVIAFDACTMGSMEVCYAFEGLCTDFVASQAGIPATGFPYDWILEALAETPSMESEQLSEVIVAEYVREYLGRQLITMSAFRVDVVCTEVGAALSEFADGLIALDDRYDRDIQDARDAVSGFDMIPTDPDGEDSYSADLYYFAQEIASRVHDERVQTAAASLTDALEDARIALGVCNQFKRDGEVFGLMIFWPDVAVYLEEYTAERLALDTTWDEFLLSFYLG